MRAITLVLFTIVFFSASATAQVRLDESEGEAASDLAFYADADEIANARRAFVNYMVLYNIPFVQPSGDRKWDATTGPDLLIKVRDTQGNTIATTRFPVIEDVRPEDLPIYLELGAQVSDFDRVYAVEVFDHDDWTGNEFMFETQSFAAADAQRAGKTSIDLLSRGGDVIGKVYFGFGGGSEPTSDASEIQW